MSLVKIGMTFLKEFIEYLKTDGSRAVTLDSTDLSGPHRYDGQLMAYLKAFRVQKDKPDLTAGLLDQQLENLDYRDLIHHVALAYKNEKSTSGIIADLVKSGRLLRILRRLQELVEKQ